MNKNNYSVDITVNGRKVVEYTKDWKTYIEGKENSVYAIKITNNTYKKAKAVITVDGFSVLNDDKEDYESGYLVDARQTITIKGFRTSDETEAEFTFTTKGDSRAQKVQGYAKNCGVIGVRMYEEKQQHTYHGYGQSINAHWTDSQSNIRSFLDSGNSETLGLDNNDISSSLYSCKIDNNMLSMNSIECSANNTPDFDLGSKMGKDVSSHIKHVEFETGALKSEFEIYYASRESLKDIGIDFRKKKEVHVPKAFNGYCKRPK